MSFSNKPLPGIAWRGLFFGKEILREGCEGLGAKHGSEAHPGAA